MKITYRYALNLSVLPLFAKGTGWEFEETDENWWEETNARRLHSMKDGDKLLAGLQQKAELRDRCHQFLKLLLCCRLYAPDWLYWQEWIDASRS